MVGVPDDRILFTPTYGSAYVFTRSGSTWSLQAKLVASDGPPSTHFGAAVAISGDTAVIGANFTSTGGASGLQGAAYVFTRTGTTWTQQAKLLAADSQGGDYLGTAVSISGDTAVIGAPRNDANHSSDDSGGNEGAVYVFTRSGATWSQQAKLTEPNRVAGDLFGQAVSIENNVVSIGAPGGDVGANADQGAAYVFTRSGTTWAAGSAVIAPDGIPGAGFGSAVALSGTSVLIGAPNDSIGGNAGQGSAYVFAQAGASWTLQSKLVAADGAASDRFGSAVALDGNDAAIGATAGGNPKSGAGYIYTRSGSNWSAQAELFGADAAASDAFGASISLANGSVLSGAYLHDVGANGDQGAAYVLTRSGTTWQQQAELAQTGTAPPSSGFGATVSIHADTAVVGVPVTNGNQGNAYVFSRVGTVWVQQAILTAPDGIAADSFGTAVSVDGDTIAIGAIAARIGNNTNQGAVYIYTRGDGSWPLQAKLSASGGLQNDRFASAVAVRGDTLLVGDGNASVGANATQGAAYVFTRSAGAWTQRARLLASNGAAADRFGSAVALDGGTAVIAATGADAVVTNSGAAYVFVGSASTWTQQTILLDPSPVNNGSFGTSVAVSGNTALVGRIGAAYAFVSNGTSWSTQATFPLGVAVAIDGDVAVVGAGAVFLRTGTTWAAQNALPAPAARRRIRRSGRLVRQHYRDHGAARRCGCALRQRQ